MSGQLVSDGQKLGMRLYLSSYRLGRHVEWLKALLPKRPRALILANALDGFSMSLRRKLTAEEYDPYSELEVLSFTVSDFDLRQFFGAPEDLTKTLRTGDLVWILGGNSFVLRRAMALSGFDAELVRLLRSDDLIYGGFSAGAVVAARTLHGIHLMDNPHDVPDGYLSAVIWNGLGWIWSTTRLFRISIRIIRKRLWRRMPKPISKKTGSPSGRFRTVM